LWKILTFICMEKGSTFVDADAIIALNAPNHSLFERAVKISGNIAKENRQIFTCTYTILEATTVANMHIKQGLGPFIAKSILNSPQITVISGDKFLKKGIEKMEGIKSKNVSLNDCVYFAIAESFGIKEIFSFDAHWTKNGFKLLS